MSAAIAILAVLLGISVGTNVLLVAYARSTSDTFSRALTDLVSRVNTSERVEIRPAEPVAAPSDKPRYITDTPYMDDSWNEFRGDVEDDE